MRLPTDDEKERGISFFRGCLFALVLCLVFWGVAGAVIWLLLS